MMRKFDFKKMLRTSYVWIVLAVIYIPLIVVMFLSFTQPSIKGNITAAFDWNDGSNYLDLSNDQFVEALVNTIIISIIVVPVSIIIAILTCFGIWHAKSIYQKTTIFTSQTNIMIPDIITGMSLALLFASTFIPLGFSFGFTTIILAHISYCTPYAIMMIYPRMIKMKKNLILASYDLGYSKIATFFKVILPFLVPAIISATVMVFAMSFDDFIITRLVGGKINTISTELYSMARGIKVWAVSLGALMIMLIFVIVSIIVLHKTIKVRKQRKKYMKNKLEIWNKQV